MAKFGALGTLAELAPPAQCREMLMQPMQHGARLADNAVHSGFRRQGVAGDGNMEAMGERSFCNEAEALLGVALPIATMEEEQCCSAGSLIRGASHRPDRDAPACARMPRCGAANPSGSCRTWAFAPALIAEHEN